jgi:hypothetical protein
MRNMPRQVAVRTGGPFTPVWSNQVTWTHQSTSAANKTFIPLIRNRGTKLEMLFAQSNAFADL